MNTGKKEISKIAGGSLQVKYYPDIVWVSWKSISLGYFEKKDEKWLYYNYINKDVAPQEVEEDKFEEYVITRCWENIDELKARCEEEKKRNIEYRLKAKEEKAKYYHLELKDLTKEHNLFYSDIISTRLRNALRAAEKYTLEELAEMKKNDLLQIRNFGQKTIEEIESLFELVDLDWNMASKTTREKQLGKYSDEELLGECRRRGLILD